MESFKLRLQDDGVTSTFLARIYVNDNNEFLDIDMMGALDCGYFDDNEFTVLIAFTIKHYKDYDPLYLKNSKSVLRNALIAGDDLRTRSKKQEQDKEELQRSDPHSFVVGWLYPHVKKI